MFSTLTPQALLMASWVIVSAIVYRQMGKGAFALLSFVRGTIGILNYAWSLAPAMIRLLAEARGPKPSFPFPKIISRLVMPPLRVGRSIRCMKFT